jgi:hypothetical protein
MTSNEDESAFTWTDDATEAFAQVPEAVKHVAKRAIEQKAESRGATEIDAEMVSEIIDQLGSLNLDEAPAAEPSGEVRDAELVVFKKLKKHAPDFHRHIATGKVQGQVVKKGDVVLVYEIEETSPPGPVKVTQETRLEFK